MTSDLPAQHYESTDGLNLYYRDFSPDAEGIPVVCLPGLTRNSRDFEEIALHLGDRHRVLTPDLRGRGYSDYDPDWRNYHPGTYVADTWRLLDLLNIKDFVILGTSLGGLIAMAMAYQDSSRLKAVVMNDIGPEIGAEGLARILKYAGLMPPVNNWDEALAQSKSVYGPWLPGLTEDDWAKMVRRSYREGPDGKPRLDMDPEIGTAVRGVGPQVGDPWVLFDALKKTPTLVLHGILSDILTPDILQKMQARKPDLLIQDVAQRGHVPLLDEPECISAIDAFLGRV